MRRWALVALLLLLLAVGRTPCAEGAGLLENPDFGAWKDDLPAGWTVSVGATDGDGPLAEVSEVSRGPGGGLRLAGTATTRQWRLVTQPLGLPGGTVLRFTCEARVQGLQREAGQRRNAYVGLGWWKEAGGPLAGLVAEHALREAWTPIDEVLRVTEGQRAGPAVFLSMTGALEVRGVGLEAVPREGAYDLLVAQVARHYSFLAQKGPGLPGGSWAAHAAALSERGRAAGDEDALVAVLRELLAPLADLHVTIRRPDGRIVPTHVPATRFNVDLKSLRKALGEITTAGRAGFVASLDGEIGYVAVTSLQGPATDHAKLRTLLQGLFAKRALVIDLRGNGGGDEARALALVGLLTDQARPYARRRVRNGPEPRDLSPGEEALLLPVPVERAFRGPIAVLLGPGCVSSGEGMAQMLDALPNVRTLGQPTLGASGNPAPVPLPGGVDVWISRWVDEQMDGTGLEGRGVQPDVRVAHEGPGDPTLAAGLAELKRLLSK